MEKIILPIGAGKTRTLIEKSAEHFYYIVCKNRERADLIQEHAIKLGLDIPFPISWKEFFDGKYYGKNIRGFLIDDLDDILQSMTNVPIKAITMTDDE